MSSSSHDHSTVDHGHDNHGEHHAGDVHAHVASPVALLATFFTLIVLTYVTVKATDFDFGAANLFIALIIAVIKATVVALFFMHLAHDRPINLIAFCGSLLFLGVFLWFTLLDSAVYQPAIQKRTDEQIQEDYKKQLEMTPPPSSK